MRKLFTIFTVVVLTTTMSLAQDLTSKKGESYIPEGDEWSIGFDATPLLNYFGNFIGNADASNSAPTVSSPYSSNGATFYGKKMIDETSAWRARVALGFGSSSASEPNSITYTATGNTIALDGVDKTTVSSFGLDLWLGKEFRKGNTRLQGFYGAEVGLGSTSSKTTMDYAHSLDLEELADASGSTTAPYTGSRTTEHKPSSSFTLAARVFIGAEYFVLPKMSLSAEYGWGLGVSAGGEEETTTESRIFNSTANTMITTSNTVKGGSAGSFGIGNDLRGAIAVNLYF